MCGGKPNKWKRILLNECLSLCATKWYNITRYRKDGVKVHLQPGPFKTYMKKLFSIFRQYGIQYNYKKDFNRNGEFGAILISTWREGMFLFLFIIYIFFVSHLCLSGNYFLSTYVVIREGQGP